MNYKTLLIALVAPLLFGSCAQKQKPEEAPAIDTIPMMVMQIQKCARLYTAENQVHKIVTHMDQRHLKGSLLYQKIDITLPFGDRKVAIPMDATLKAYIDFSRFDESSVRRHGQKVEIVLPDPKVELTSSKINHTEIKKQVALLRSDFTDAELSNYEKQGRAAIINDIPRMGIIDMARQNAANTLIPLLADMGFPRENITVTFRKQFSDNDIRSLLDKKTFGL